MEVLIDKSKKIDVLLIAEGTYPYIRGGVSTWIHDLITGIEELNFGVVFLGSRREDYTEIKYKFPDNLVYLLVTYLFDETEKPKPREIEGDEKVFDYIDQLHKWFKSEELPELPNELKKLDFYTEFVKYSDFLYSKRSWDFIANMYVNYAPEESFVDYFWTIRNIHAPIWIIANVAKNVKEFDIVHSPSTGYAGFLASLLKNHHDKPFILTEHGIYTKERKIDLLNADWLRDKRLFFQKDIGEIDHIRNMWIRFFFGIGKFIYNSADKIISLFNDAREVQLSYGADPSKCIVIPNGVDIDGLLPLVEKRGEQYPKVVGLLGRVVPIKDIKTFIKAMKITVDKVPEAQGWIIGPTDEDPEYYEECRNLVEALELEDKVLFLGFQNIKEILPKIGLLTLTSISEGMPLVVLEGFAAGLPCVATDVGSCRQLIYGGLNEDDIKIGKAGEVVPIANPQKLAENYIKLLTDENLWKEYQKNGLERVKKFYTKKMFLDNYRQIYREVRDGRDIL
ncbi:MAG: GT4 family glycosyltransferase PelF [Hydrogenothermaceae bacterium]